MKNKIQTFFTKFISLFLCLFTLMGNSCLPVYAADTYQYISSFKTYGKDTFPEEYAYGVVDLASATKVTKGSGVTTTTNVGTGNVENFIGYCGNNTSFSDAYSVTYTKGARYKNEYYDVKIRFRTTDSKYYWMNLVPKRLGEGRMPQLGADYNINGQKRYADKKQITEWHFYKTGTNQEVSFKGVMSLDDLDGGPEVIEGYGFRNGAQLLYATSDTDLRIASSNQTHSYPGWGTQNIPKGSVYGTTTSYGYTTEKQVVYVVFSSSPGSPFSFDYFDGTTWGSDMGTSPSLDIKYNIVSSSDYKANQTITTDKFDKYGEIYRIQNYQENLAAYTFDGWYSDSGLKNKVTSFSNVQENKTVYGKYTLKRYNITTKATGATITASETGIGHGSDRTVSWEAYPESEITSVTVDGVKQTITDKKKGSITFNDIAANHTVEVKGTAYEALYFYDISTSAKNATVTESIVDIPWGQDRTVTWKPNTGYHLTQVTIDGTPLSKEETEKGTYTFSKIQANHTVNVEAAIDTYPITTKGTNVTIDASISDAEYGSSHTINWTANEGYYVTSIKVDGEDINIENVAKGSYTFDNVTSAHTIEVVGTIYKYNIDTQATNATITESQKDVPYGESRTIEWKVKNGYHITSVMVDNEEIPVEDVTKGFYTFDKVTANHTVKVQAEENFKITTSAQNAQITPSISNILPQGNKKITWDANDGYYIDKVTVDNQDIEITDIEKGEYTFGNIQENHTITVHATKKYTVTTQGTHVTIDKSVSNINPHSNQTIQWTAEAGYWIHSITVDGEKIPVENNTKGEYTFSDIMEDHSISVVAHSCYTITTEITNGTITPSIDNIYPGENTQVTYTPNEGYYVAEIIVDGQAYSYKDYPEAYDFKNINEPHTIKVVCEPLKTVTTEIENGEITKTITGIHPDTDTEVIYKAFEDYYISKVEVDGKEVSNENFIEGKWLFKPTEKDHTVKVVCKPKPTIYTSIDHGEITPEFKVYPKEDGIVEATPKENYYITKITVDGKEVPIQNETQYKITFTNINEDHHVVIETTEYPKLKVTKESDKEQYNYQDVVAYTVVIEQPVKDTYIENVTARDVLPKDVTLDPKSVKVSGIAENSYTLNTEEENGFVFHTNRLSDTEPVTITYQAKVSNPKIVGKKIENTVRLSGDRIEEKEVSASVENEVLKPDYSIKKTANAKQYNIGDTISYDIEAKQTVKGAVGYDVTIQDTVPEQIELDKESIVVEGLDKDMYEITTKDNTISVLVKQMSDETVHVKFTGTVSKDCAGQTITNMATLKDPDAQDKTYESTTKNDVLKPDFTIEKVSDKAEYNANDTIGYTITAKQTVKDAIGYNVTIQDTLPELINLNADSIAVSGTKADNYTINVKDNTLSVVFNTLTDSETVTVSFKGKFADNAVGQSVENTAILTLPALKDKEYKDTVENKVLKPDFEIKKTADKEFYNAGNEIQYTIDAKQTVEGAVGQNVLITDVLPEQITLDTESVQIKGLEEDQYSIETKDNTVSVTIKEFKDSDNVSILFTGTLSMDTVGQEIENTATLTIPNIPDKTYEDKIVSKVLTPEFEINKTANKEEYNTGETIEYTITAKETVENAIGQDVVIQDTFPEQVTLDKERVIIEGTSEENYEVNVTENTVTITVKKFTFEEPMTIKIKGQLSEDCMGQEITNKATLSIPNILDKVYEAEVKNKVLQPDYKIEKTSDKQTYKENEEIKYTITAEQTTKDAIGKNIVISDVLPNEVYAQKDSVVVHGVKDYQIKWNEGILTVESKELEYGKPITITFKGTIVEDDTEVTNIAKLTSDSVPGKEYEAKTTAKIGKTKEEKPQTGLKNPYFVGFAIGAFALAIGFVIFLNIRKKYE